MSKTNPSIFLEKIFVILIFQIQMQQFSNSVLTLFQYKTIIMRYYDVYYPWQLTILNERAYTCFKLLNYFQQYNISVSIKIHFSSFFVFIYLWNYIIISNNTQTVDMCVHVLIVCIYTTMDYLFTSNVYITNDQRLPGGVCYCG